ncbi:RNA polymerase sigma factor [Luteimonas saliphila]|uniref:RNA polymerase sigma factor n=1 Tax=Luteimonas saliphila TaxID=2804919 RepID=UPI00192DBC0B|nr:RNA polymerase sigma factor [Luteimonas saliphila]
MAERDALKDWFQREVLPLEGALMRYLRRNWRVEAEVPDLRQDIYVRMYEAACRQVPQNPQSFLFVTARNHLIDRARQASIVSFDQVADLENALPPEEALTPLRVASSREELRRVQAGLDTLPPRCREVIVLRKVQGLSQKETAMQLGVSIKAVEQQTTRGMRTLIDFVLGGGATDRRAAHDTSDKEAEHER